jgi:DnaA family protein
LFGLYNRVQGAGASLLLAAARPPAALGIELPDLRSRLQALLVLSLTPPGDDDRLQALVRQAHSRGMTLEAEVARYILNRAPRGMQELVAVLERLDRSSLAAGRRLSIPFVRETLGWAVDS